MTFEPTGVRAAAVAGSFYPGSPEELRRAVEGHLAESPAVGAGGRILKALIAPHAGYVYSGPIAGSAFGGLPGRAGEIERVVLLGPSHFAPVEGLALPDAAALETPLGEVPVDLETARSALALPQVVVEAAAHAREHSLEVELPFLQVALGDFGLLPLSVGAASGEAVAEVLEAVWGGPETLIVVSSDLSHYHPYETARQLDRETAESITALAGPLPHGSACGVVPINGLLLAAKRRRLEARGLDLRSSGDTAGGRDQVVGYGAFAFYEK